MRLGLSFTLLLAVVGVARADESRPRSIWLECKTPAVWPVRPGTPLRLTCRIDNGTSGPAYWQTVNPFAPTDTLALVDPFEVEARLVDPFEAVRGARPRAQRPLLPPLDLPSSTIDPFEPQDSAPAR
jgi:hypothetical protein